MDRNGKKAKAQPSPESLHAERSDTKASTRDVLGRAAGGAGGQGGKSAQGAPTGPARKGHRG